ncbi:MAG: hypothetical protein AB7O45_08620 [Alphaproteobacteria bacterium]
MNAILGNLDQQARIFLALGAPARLAAAIGRRVAAARTRQDIEQLAPRQRRDMLGDALPSAIGPRVDADPHAVRMLMHVGR